MKFVVRTVLLGLCLVLVFLSLCYLYTNTSTEVVLLDYVTDHYGDECHYQDNIYQEGEVFKEQCKECYCSFGVIECTAVHCTDISNTLGRDLIRPDIQILIPTTPATFPGTITVMNSVLSHTSHSVKFTLVLCVGGEEEEEETVQSTHLNHWIAGSLLRAANYVVVPVKDKISEWVGMNERSIVFYKAVKMFGSKDKVMDKIDKMKITPSLALLMLSTILSNEHRVIVLSNNVLITGDVADLFYMDLQGKPIAGTCTTQRHHVSEDLLLHFGVHQNLSCLFSEGVIIADLDAWFTAGIEEKLSHILYNMILTEDPTDFHNLPYSTLVLHFWDKFLDLQEHWSIYSVENQSPSLTVLNSAKVLDWGSNPPWKSGPVKMFDLWKKYFLDDPTGMFRLKSL